MCVACRSTVKQGAQGEGHTSSQEQAKANGTQCLPEGDKGKYAHPAHQDVDQGREVALVLKPDTLVDHAQDGQSPDDSKEGPTGPAPDADEAVGGVSPGNQDKDHCVIKNPKEVPGPGEVEGVEEGRGKVEED